MVEDSIQLHSTEFEGDNKNEIINNLYINASFVNKLFGCWAGTYSRWVNKNNGLHDSTDVAYIEKTNTTEVLTEFINDQVYKMYGDFKSSEG